jgi:ABC-type nitrate/sulfonate/bicarbonate transport system substrate-binding protein
VKGTIRRIDADDACFAPVDDAIASQQQAVADRFHRVGLIPKPIVVRDIVWTWKPAA